MGILDLLFPKRCVNCGKVGKYFCSKCSSIIRIIKPNEAVCPVCQRPAVDGVTHPKCRTRYMLDGQTNFFRYDGPVRKAVKLLKYRLVSDLALEFVSLIPAQLLRQIRQPADDTLLIPVPLHQARQRTRGFNQAEVLARLLASRLRMGVRTDILYRTKHARPQADIKDKKDRLKNMHKAFSVRPSLILHHSSFILFDDVTTTGATLSEAARVLKKGGAKSVWAVTIAR